MNAHWLGGDLTRRTAVLACRRVTGSHTYDVVGKAMVDVLIEFEILHKVVRITTDNGSNFRKAFR